MATNGTRRKPEEDEGEAKPLIPRQQLSKFETAVNESMAEARQLPPLKGVDKLGGAGIKTLVDGLVKFAYLARASDIHIDPNETGIVVRYRVDGILHDVLVLPKQIQSMVISRIKVLSDLRTDEHQSSQDGRFRIMQENNVPVDLRVSIIPTFYGENVVMRLLVGQARALELEDLGFSERDLATVQENMRKSYGMILATGPTGSGKTTTLYSILQILNQRKRSIITIEDPIEYAIPGITHIQTNVKTNLTFAQGLRAIVRQDPNIIMVGEIRDRETAAIATNAAMTGHLLLSSLHTNDAAVTLPRLIDMGIEPFLIASTVNIAIGQRLVRRLCGKCASTRTLTKVEQASLQGFVPASILKRFSSFAEPTGCKVCNNTGYVGRLGIYEVLEVTERIRHMIMQRENSDAIRKVAQDEGMTTMLEDGLRKAAEGVTSIGEILRVIHE